LDICTFKRKGAKLEEAGSARFDRNVGTQSSSNSRPSIAEQTPISPYKSFVAKRVKANQKNLF